MEQQRRAKIRRWTTAGFAVALAGMCILQGRALAQSAATQNPSSSTKATSTAATSTPQTKPATSHSGASKHPSTAATTHSGKTKRTGSRATVKKTSRKKTVRGQQKIDSERAQAIQEALIREHYLSGEAAGTWNQASEDAMRRYQADHGWQSKTVPDARALISLGLGPNHDHLLNPESAMTTEPPPTHAAALTPVSHSADPGSRMSTPAPDATATPAAAGDQSSPQ